MMAPFARVFLDAPLSNGPSLPFAPRYRSARIAWKHNYDNHDYKSFTEDALSENLGRARGPRRGGATVDPLYRPAPHSRGDLPAGVCGAEGRGAHGAAAGFDVCGDGPFGFDDGPDAAHSRSGRQAAV